MQLSEVDLMMYILAVEKGYNEMLELYGILHEHQKCPSCGKSTGSHHKAIRDIIDTFGGGRKSLRVPAEDALKKIGRDLTIWKGVSACVRNGTSQAMRIHEYAERYQVTSDSVYKIYRKVQALVDKYIALREVFKGQQS